MQWFLDRVPSRKSHEGSQSSENSPLNQRIALFDASELVFILNSDMPFL